MKKSVSTLFILAVASFAQLSVAQGTPTQGAPSVTQPAPAAAEAAPPPSPSAPGSAGPSAPPAAALSNVETTAETAPKSLDERRMDALVAFYTGEVDKALDEMKQLLRECLASPDCSLGTRAILYRDAGIIAADGKQDHVTAVRAFRRAIAADRSISIPDKHQTTKVNLAFEEARQAEGLAPPPTPTPAGLLASAPSPPAEVATVVAAPRTPNVLLHITSGLKVGPIWTYGAEGVGQLTLETLVAHVGKTNTLAGALAHVDYNFALDDPSNFGSWGLSAMIGGASRRTAPAKLHYLTGGVGFVHWPFVRTAGLAFHARYGASFRGFALGLDADLSYIPGAYRDVTQLLFGFHVGFAKLL